MVAGAGYGTMLGGPVGGIIGGLIGGAALLGGYLMLNEIFDDDYDEADVPPERKPKNDKDKSRRSKPTNCPANTKSIDQHPDLDREDIHDIKDQIGAGPRDWVA